MKTSILLTSGATAATIIQKWLFADLEFLKWLLIAITLDLLTGIAKVWIKDGYKAVTSKGIRMSVMKVIQYGAFLIITHVLTNFTVGGLRIAPLGFITSWAYTLLLLIEIKSVYENIVAIDNRLDFINSIVKNISKVIKQKTDEKDSE